MQEFFQIVVLYESVNLPLVWHIIFSDNPGDRGSFDRKLVRSLVIFAGHVLDELSGIKASASGRGEPQPRVHPAL